MSEAATSSSRRARPDHHRLPLVSWRPPFELRELLDAWAKERGGSRQGRSRAEAVTRLVSQALQAGDEALTEGAANEVVEEIGEAQADLCGLGIQLAELRAQLDRLGPATLAVKHVVAHWMSRDPANRTLGETPEMLEERLLFEMDQIGSDNWRLLHEDDLRPRTPGWGSPQPPRSGAPSSVKSSIGRAAPGRRRAVNSSSAPTRIAASARGPGGAAASHAWPSKLSSTSPSLRLGSQGSLSLRLRRSRWRLARWAVPRRVSAPSSRS